MIIPSLLSMTWALLYLSDTPTSLSLVGGLHSSVNVAGVKRLSGLMSALNSMETMQKSVMNAFALKYSQLYYAIMQSMVLLSSLLYRSGYWKV